MTINASDFASTALNQAQVDASIDARYLGQRKRLTLLPGAELHTKDTDGAPFDLVEVQAGGVQVQMPSYELTEISNLNDFCQWTWIVPPSADPAAGVRFRALFCPSTTNTGTVKFNYRGSVAGDDEDMPVSAYYGTFGGTTPGGTAFRMQYTDWHYKAISGLALDDAVNFQFYRIPGDAGDTFSGIIHVLAIEFEYYMAKLNDN
jgi:hypothetical protein